MLIALLHVVTANKLQWRIWLSARTLVVVQQIKHVGQCDILSRIIRR